MTAVVLTLGVLMAVGGPLIAPGGAHPAERDLGQQAPNNSTGTTTLAPGGTTTGNATGNVTGGGGIDLGFGVNIDLGSFVSGLSSAFANLLLSIGTGSVDIFNSLVFQVPAPGSVNNVETIANPSGAIWESVYGGWPATMVIGLPLFALAIATVFASNNERTRRRGYKRLGLATLMVMLAPVLPGLILNAANAMAVELAPSGSEFFSTPGNVGKLGAGVGIGFILAFVNSAAIAIGLVVIALETVLIYVTVYLWLVAWAAYACDVAFVRSLGQTVIYTFGVVVAAKLVQALIARFLFELPLGGEAMTTLFTLLLTVAGVLFTFIYFPKSMLDHANDSASMSLGVSAAEQQAQKGGEVVQRSMDRVRGRVREEAGNVASNVRTTDEASQTTSRQSVGEVGAAGSNRRGRSPGAHLETRTPGEPTFTDGIDANDWAAQREHASRDRNRMFQ